jgi:hypothetical protein
MTAFDLEQLISQEITQNVIDNWHSITKENIHRHLVKPFLKQFISASEGQEKKYWLVLDEYPKSQIEGYLIVYDEDENMFGLATKISMKETELGEVIGLYGTFISTLNAM